MATNQDFDTLINRISVATDTLESSVNLIDGTAVEIQNVEQTVLQYKNEAQQAVADAQAAAGDSSVSATEAQQAFNDAAALVTQLEQAVIIEEAPKDGEVYGRKDGEWVIAGSGGGSGTVTSVNTIGPDAQGDVTLTAADVGAKEDTYVPTWTEVEGKPSFASVATTGEYADLRNKPVLAPVATSGSYTDLTDTPTIPTATSELTNDSGFITSAPAFPTNTDTLYDGADYLSEWVSKNPHKLAPLNYIAYYAGGRFIQGEDVFYGSNRDISQITPAKYEFGTSSFSQGPLVGKSGVIEVADTFNGDTKYITAYANPVSGDTEGESFIWNDVDGEFIAVGASSGGGGTTGGFPLGMTITYDGVDYTTWPKDNPNASLYIPYITAGGLTGEDLFAGNTALENLPAGNYSFLSSTFTSGALDGKLGIIQVKELDVGSQVQKRAFAFLQATSTDTEGFAYSLKGDGTWLRI
jgi:hypothetical protein